MIIATAVSKNNVPIRLTRERWFHITNSHKEITSKDKTTIIDIINNPDLILRGDVGELLAVKKVFGKNLWFVVVYKEIDNKDGFVLTAYITTDSRWLFRRKILWNKK